MTTAVNSVLGSNAAAAAASSAAPAISSDATQDRFLKLLIAQMKNQDPQNPLDNAAVTSQMAQINTVQGISQLNTTLSTMLTQLQGSQAMSLPGHQVLIAGNKVALANNGSGLSARAGFDLAADADNVAVDIKDASGNLVTTLNLGAQASGAGTFHWDGSTPGGSAPAGNYTFSVKASAASAGVAASGLMAATVTGSTSTPQGVRLTLDGLGARNYSDVRMVL